MQGQPNRVRMSLRSMSVQDRKKIKNRRANPVSGFDTLVAFIKEVDSPHRHC